MDIISYFQEMWQLATQSKLQGIWFFAALYVLVVCLYSLIFQLQTRSWSAARGELVNAGLEKFGREAVPSEQHYNAGALYYYEVEGKRYKGTRISPWIVIASHNLVLILQKQLSAIQQFPDGRVKVFYNPKKPQKSFLIIAGKMGIVITIAIAVLPMVLFLYKYYG